jgi:hypothetical protein
LLAGANVLAMTPEGRGALEILIDHLGEEYVPPANALGKESPLGNFCLPLPIDLAGESLRPDPLSMLPPMLVVVAHPPDAGAGRSFEDAARPSSVLRCFRIVALRHLG